MATYTSLTNPLLKAAFVYPEDSNAADPQVNGGVQASQGDVYVLQSCGVDCHIWAKLAPGGIQALVFTSAESSIALQVDNSDSQFSSTKTQEDLAVL